MMLEPVVSIIIPVYNAGKFLEQCLSSLQTQTYSKLEIICVDDASADNSLEICNSFKNRDARFKTIHFDINKGVSCARNTGLSVSGGEYVCFIDSDDYVSRDYVRDLLEAYRRGNAELSLCGYTVVTENGKTIWEYSPSFRMIQDEKNLHKYFRELADKKYILTVCAKLYKKSIISQNGIMFDETLSKGEDAIFNFRYFSTIHTISVSSKAVYYYRMKEASSLHRLPGNGAVESAARVLEEGCLFCAKKHLSGYGEMIISKGYLKNIFMYLEVSIESGFPAKEIKKQIKEVRNKEEMKRALKNTGKSDIEYLIYKAVILMPFTSVITGFIKLRRLLKNKFRGY